MDIIFAKFQSAGPCLISQNCWQLMEICLVSTFASSPNILEWVPSNSVGLCISKCYSRLLRVFSCAMETGPVFQLRWLGIQSPTTKNWRREDIRYISLFLILCRCVLTVSNKEWRFSLVLLFIAYVFIETFFILFLCCSLFNSFCRTGRIS